MIKSSEGKFVLSTKNTTYVFDTLKAGHLRHLYYGKKLEFSEDLNEFEILIPKREFGPGATIIYDKENPAYAPEDTCFEVSAYGKGDLRSPFVSIVYADGSRTSDFVYESHTITKGKKERRTLPGS